MDLVVYAAGFFITLARFVFFFIGSAMERAGGASVPNDYYPSVSVIVPAKDEEKSIEKCVRSIAECEYPNDKYEIIAVNDRSTDKTGEILERLSEEIPNLKVITVAESDKSINLTGKPGAIQRGADSATGEIIMITDADCFVSKNWVKTHAAKFANPNVGMNAAVTYVGGERVFDKFQSLEWIYLSTIGSGAIGFGIPLSCFGNNISFRRDIFERLGGYREIKFSVTEDLALLHAVAGTGMRINYFPSADALIETLPAPDFAAYFRQHSRWVVGAKSLGFKAALWIATSFALWAALIYSAAKLDFGATLFFLGLKIVADAALLIPGLIKLKLQKLIPWIFPAVFFFLFMELLSPFQALKKKVKWKNQNLSNA